MKHAIFRTTLAVVALIVLMTGMTFGILGCRNSGEESSQEVQSSSQLSQGEAVSSEESKVESSETSKNEVSAESSKEESAEISSLEESSKAESSKEESSKMESSKEESSVEESSEEESYEEESEEDVYIDYDTKYLVRVNKSTNVITIYTRDSNGNHTVPVKAMTCSTGYATPEGTFVMGYQARWNGLNGDTWGQYVSHITGNFLFHTVPALWKSENGVYTYYYNQLGTTCSQGCVRMTAGDAYWMYNNCTSFSTIIEIGYFGGGADPLGKPATIQLPTEYSTNWDPTDPSPDNPWNGCTPYFSGVKDYKIMQGDDVPDMISGVRGYDTCGNDKTSWMTVSGSVNPYQPGEYVITYSLTDVLGRTGTAVAKVTVEAPPQEESSKEESSVEESSKEESSKEESSKEESSKEESSKEESSKEESSKEESSVEESSKEESSVEESSVEESSKEESSVEESSMEESSMEESSKEESSVEESSVEESSGENEQNSSASE